MKTDLYTKVVLTVIAALLTLNLLKTDGFITKANASVSPGYVDVPLNADGSINVKVIASDPQEVLLIGWKEARVMEDGTKQSFTKEIPYQRSGRNGIPVRIIEAEK